MTPGVTDHSTLPNAIEQQIVAKALSVRKPNLIFNIPASEHVMRSKAGSEVRFFRPNPLELPLIPLSESGDPVPGQSLTGTYIDAKIRYYGTHTSITDQIVVQNQVDVHNQAALQLGLVLRETEDRLTRDMLLSSCSFINATAGTNGDTPTNPTADDFAILTQTLRENDAEPIMDMIEGENKIGTGPVQNAYMALGHTRLQSELRKLDGFEKHSQYPTQGSVLRAEYGSVDDLRFLLSSVGGLTVGASALGGDVFETPCVGQDAYKKIKQTGYNTQIMYNDPRFSDELRQRSSIGIKFPYASVITQETWVINFRSTAS